jgi:hypothetical protein
MLELVERRGIWETYKVDDVLEMLRASRRPGESLTDLADAYKALFEVEARNTVDPTGKAIPAYQLIDSLLRPEETHLEAARAYAQLWLFERKYRDIDPSHWTHEDYRAIDAAMPAGQSRLSNVRQFASDPRGYAAAKAAEAERIQRAGDEVVRMAEGLAPQPAGPGIVEEDSWIVVGGVGLPRRA